MHILQHLQDSCPFTYSSGWSAWHIPSPSAYTWSSLDYPCFTCHALQLLVQLFLQWQVIWWGWHVWLWFQHWNHHWGLHFMPCQQAPTYLWSMCFHFQTCLASNMSCRMQMSLPNLIEWIWHWIVQLLWWVHYLSLRNFMVYPPQVTMMAT